MCLWGVVETRCSRLPFEFVDSSFWSSSYPLTELGQALHCAKGGVMETRSNPQYPPSTAPPSAEYPTREGEGRGEPAANKLSPPPDSCRQAIFGFPVFLPSI